jgi:hypothetical protein
MDTLDQCKRTARDKVNFVAKFETLERLLRNPYQIVRIPLKVLVGKLVGLNGNTLLPNEAPTPENASNVRLRHTRRGAFQPTLVVEEANVAVGNVDELLEPRSGLVFDLASESGQNNGSQFLAEFAGGVPESTVLTDVPEASNLVAIVTNNSRRHSISVWCVRVAVGVIVGDGRRRSSSEEILPACPEPLPGVLASFTWSTNRFRH